MEFTQQEVTQKEHELREVSNKLTEALQQQQEAKALGDFRENAELEAATKEVRELQHRKAELLEQLSDYTLVKSYKGQRIMVGDYVEIIKLDKNTNNIRRFRLAAEGDTIDSGTLSIDSPLGKAILNGTSGIYTIQAPGGAFRYDVKKVTGE